MTIQDLTRGITGCACGREHACPIDIVEIAPGVIGRLDALCADHHHILLVADQNTWRVCGEQAARALGGRVADTLVFDSGDHYLVPDERAIDEIRAHITPDIDLIFGVGSGVINDLCKHTSFQAGLPYYILATATSMDGYASVGAALILGGMKVTTNARPPKAIFADPAVLKDAPLEMLQAGWGDIIGKYSCLNDWKLAACVRDEYFCQTVYDLTAEQVERVRSLADGVAARDEAAVGALMEALVVVGIAMSYVGNSRPASGSEHHFSHYFEITGILRGEPYLPHGIDVLYSAVATAKLREAILARTPARRDFDKAAWEREIGRVYGSSAAGVIALQEKLGWYEQDDAAAEKWDDVCRILREAPGEAEMRGLVARIGLDYADFEKLYGAEKIADAVLYAKDLKDRYTVLWLWYVYFRMDKNRIRLVVFDLDGTLTQHRSPMSERNRATLDALGSKYKLLMAGAGKAQRIFDQMERYPIDILGNYGMQFGMYNAASGALDIVRDDHLPCDRESVAARVEMLREKHGFTEYAGESVEFHDSGCVTWPLIGTQAKIGDKLAFDPDRSRRRAIYDEVRTVFSDYTVFIGGSSSFDMVPAPYDKAYALRRYCAEHGYAPDEVVFVGDDYRPGGNDESVYRSEFGFIRVDDYRKFPEAVAWLL